ncbi:MAG: UDP-N-acetylglucosamine 2-epimerase [Planctomycetota bacterium]|jgi:UDP-N-acetylglucosamine 2-epimerase (non-hydrolysing)/GDP/UDP-N,N'-diacetylbacillosamine 2-epimerase (hydrolysing)
MRTIAVVTTSRADYGHLIWPLRALHARDGLRTRLVALAAHLSPEFGGTVEEIERDGFEVAERVECLLSSDSDVGMAKTIGVGVLGLADVLGRMRPDLMLLIADRYEMLAPAAVALALRIPIAHIEGGEVSEGAIDHAVRNALTAMSHLHFTPTASATARVVAMGEEPWRVHRVGAPSLDHLRHGSLLDRAAVERELGLDLGRPTAVVAYHPVTIERDTTCEADEVFAALAALDLPIVFCFPNADAGSRAIVRRAEAFCAGRADARLHVNLRTVLYWSLLRHAAVMVGNSSSGIMESPSLRLPAVNIGSRQDGRERAANVLDAPPRADAIVATVRAALDAGFAASLEGMTNPYGDGRAGERIAEVLATTPLEGLLRKKATPVPPAPVPGPVA